MPTRQEVQKETRQKLNKLTVANERLYKETAWRTKVSPKDVEDIINSVSTFTSKVISEGAFETVMIPNFGKFRARPKQVQFFSTLEVKRGSTYEGKKKKESRPNT